MESELSTIGIMIDQETTRQELRKLLEEKRLSPRAASNYIMLSQTSLYNFLGGKSLSYKALVKLLNGIDKIKEDHF